MQLADVLMGAVGFHCNGSHTKDGASRHKIELAAYVAAKARVRTLDQQTGLGRQAFEIWRFKFSGKAKRRPNP